MPPATPNPPPVPPPYTPPAVPSATAGNIPLPLPVVLAASSPGTPPLPVVLTGPALPPPQSPAPPPSPATTPPAVPPAVLSVAPPAPPPPSSVQNIGQMIGGPGQLAGNIATLAQGGPAGALVAAANAIQDQVEQSLKTAVSGIGEALQGVAALDGRRIAESLNSLVEKVPLVGPALGEAARQFVAFVDAVNETASRLAQYSPELATARAGADINQILGDLRRSQQLGSGLARFTEAQSRLSQTAQDILASILEQLLPIATTMLDVLNGILVAVQKTPEAAHDAADAILSKLPPGLLGLLPILQRDLIIAGLPLAALLRKIEENTRKDLDAGDRFFQELLDVRLHPPAVVAPPRTPGFTG